jgi:glycosyltransferase involved in cell wall biosynthesis
MQPVSFIVPVYNEVDNIEKLHKEILTVARSLGVAFEIIMVDDGSTDGTYS